MCCQCKERVLKGGYDWWKFYSENRKKILSTIQKFSPENFLPLPINPKNEMISLGYDVNDHVYFKSKSD